MPDTGKENSIYRDLGAEMRQGLKNIWLKAAEAGCGDRKAEAIFEEASGQLNEVAAATETAAMNIMDIVEKQDGLAEESAALIEKIGETATSPELERLAAINRELRSDLLTLLTTLSFQDITGQRIKKVQSALRELESSVLELYLASGLMLDAAEREPGQSADKLAADAREAVAAFRENRPVTSTLKGPDASGASQAAIDDMLSQLGL